MHDCISQIGAQASHAGPEPSRFLHRRGQIVRSRGLRRTRAAACLLSVFPHPWTECLQPRDAISFRSASSSRPMGNGYPIRRVLRDGDRACVRLSTRRNFEREHAIRTWRNPSSLQYARAQGTRVAPIIEPTFRYSIAIGGTACSIQTERGRYGSCAGGRGARSRKIRRQVPHAEVTMLGDYRNRRDGNEHGAPRSDARGREACTAASVVIFAPRRWSPGETSCSRH